MVSAQDLELELQNLYKNKKYSEISIKLLQEQQKRREMLACLYYWVSAECP